MDLYFAYGSNLDPHQMTARCPQARFVARAELREHRLVFGGFSRRWRGAVASVEPAPGYVVPGCVYTLGPGELELLDRFEGNYARFLHAVFSMDGGSLKPAHHYRLNPRPDLVGQLQRSDRYIEKLEAAYLELRFDLAPLRQALQDLNSLT